jgi:hypothetical protein
MKISEALTRFICFCSARMFALRSFFAANLV